MKEKKQSADWYIATTHFLTAGIAVPFVVSLAVFFISMGLVIIVPSAQDVIKKGNVIIEITAAIIMLISVWLGIIYSVRYLEKTYIIKDVDKIIKLSTIYLIVIGAIFRVVDFSKGVTVGSMINLVFYVSSVIIFYKASKKYLKNTETI